MNPDEQDQSLESHTSAQQQAAANVVRGQVDAAYAATDSQQEVTSVYHRTHTTQTQPTAEQWRQYHTAWQEYYQKYYERYYVGHLHQAQQAIATQQSIPQAAAETLSEDEAMYELRSKLLGTVRTAAVKVRKSRHFVPIASAICVMLVFAFLQYNQLLIGTVKAYVSPGSINPENIIVDPSVSTKVDPKSTALVIPKINVDVPVDYSATPDYNSQMAAMRKGLAYFGIAGANSKPGQIGNTPIAGHSSNDVFDQGNYKFIFAQLDKLQKGDTIYANYKGTRYTYTVVKKQVVKPTDVAALTTKTNKPLLTLITCTPVGTATSRLLVTAEQVNPAPSSATQSSSSSSDSTAPVQMAGTSPSLIGRLFGQH